MHPLDEASLVNFLLALSRSLWRHIDCPVMLLHTVKNYRAEA